MSWDWGVCRSSCTSSRHQFPSMSCRHFIIRLQRIHSLIFSSKAFGEKGPMSIGQGQLNMDTCIRSPNTFPPKSAVGPWQGKHTKIRRTDELPRFYFSSFSVSRLKSDNDIASASSAPTRNSSIACITQRQSSFRESCRAVFKQHFNVDDGRVKFDQAPGWKRSLLQRLL